MPIILCACTFSAQAAPVLVVNGDFETPQTFISKVDGWGSSTDRRCQRNFKIDYQFGSNVLELRTDSVDYDCAFWQNLEPLKSNTAYSLNADVCAIGTPVGSYLVSIGKGDASGAEPLNIVSATGVGDEGACKPVTVKYETGEVVSGFLFVKLTNTMNPQRGNISFDNVRMDAKPINRIADIDNDSIPDDVDNCPLVMNKDQSDIDGDGQGDVCDSDIDNDNVSNDIDNCPAIVNTEQSDKDYDGIGDPCDSEFDLDSVGGYIGHQVQNATSIISKANPPGGRGMTYSIENLAALIDKIVSDFDAGLITAEGFETKLNVASNKISAFENQITANVHSNKINETDAAMLKEIVANLQLAIDSLRTNL